VHRLEFTIDKLGLMMLDLDNYFTKFQLDFFFALLCFALLCFALLCFAFHSIKAIEKPGKAGRSIGAMDHATKN
jgi:hypothetical protein